MTVQILAINPSKYSGVLESIFLRLQTFSQKLPIKTGVTFCQSERVSKNSMINRKLNGCKAHKFYP